MLSRMKYSKLLYLVEGQVQFGSEEIGGFIYTQFHATMISMLSGIGISEIMIPNWLSGKRAIQDSITPSPVPFPLNRRWHTIEKNSRRTSQHYPRPGFCFVNSLCCLSFQWFNLEKNSM